MYTKNYNNIGELQSISKLFDGVNTVFNEHNTEYKQYLLDIEDGVEVIDNPPTDSEILEIAKQSKINDIDVKTVSLIRTGISHNSEVFSMSNEAQINYLSLQQDIETLVFPFELTTIDDNKYECLSKEDLQLILDKAKLLKLESIGSGRDLKVSIKIAADISELDAIEDPR